jgi:hypothetical protein
MALAEVMPRPIVVDLTEPELELSAAAFAYTRPREEPPTKRRRVGSDASSFAPLNKARLREHMIPHVDRAVKSLPRQGFRHDAIGIETLRMLATTPSIRIRLDETRGDLLPSDHANIARLAGEAVRQLALLPVRAHPPNSGPAANNC